MQSLGHRLLRVAAGGSLQQAAAAAAQPLAISAAAAAPAAAAAAVAAAAGVTAPLSSIRRFAAAAAEGFKRLYVGNLSWETTPEELREHFKQFGEVHEVVLPLNHTGRPRGFAFVEVAEASAAEAISGTHESQLGGRVVTVNEAQPPGEGRPARGGDGFERRSDRGGGGFGSTPREAPAAVREGCRRLYVGNLRFDCKAQQLAELFTKFGRVEDVVIPLDQLGRSRGYAFVELEEAGAESALNSMDQSDFQGRTIFIRAAHSMSDGNTRGGRGGGGGGGYGGRGGRGGYGGGGRGGRDYRQQQDDAAW